MKFWKKYHKWGGIILSIFLILFSVSGILLNHRNWISNLNVPRSILSESYQYINWNNASLKGVLSLNNDEELFYGNVGCWKYNKRQKSWKNFNSGFPKGIDNRKISKLALTSNHRLFAGTQFGLYEFIDKQWTPINIDAQSKRITDLLDVNDTLYILTRSELGSLQINQDNQQVCFRELPAPADYKTQVGLFRTLWVLHSGEIIGILGKFAVDGIAILFIFFIVTGLIWFINPKLIKKAKRKGKSIFRKQSLLRWSVKWHNKIGIYTFIFLGFTTLTGIFLRPPLLIAIANTMVDPIPLSKLDTPNAWDDQLRAINYNEKYDFFLLSTSKGFYALSSDKSEMIKIPKDPPVSVMGINVFEPLNHQEYIIGSFSGLFRWDPINMEVRSFPDTKPVVQDSAPTRPISAQMVTGIYYKSDGQYYFDYNKGVVGISDNDFPTIPDVIIENSPLSLWNFALEIHTGRIFQDFTGAFYILIVPLVGITTLLLLFSGVWIWYKKK
ncbi:PepSY domain-containing protein [Carboxylicivirga caseinilyticus]|uniref:PepSY-associated TM helix domain-containing protein n=1 Tax=Carboxylicivirga caseinilyticus TaxID=3417572 RepID=UPI003D33F9C1|nr:PepSY domain-containing protein [Marinilabiliaceae bacterium A049]